MIPPKQYSPQLMEISNDGLAKVMLKSIVDIIDGIKQLGKEQKHKDIMNNKELKYKILFGVK